MELSDISEFDLTNIINSLAFRMRHQKRFIERAKKHAYLENQVRNATESREELWELSCRLREARRNLH